MAYTNAANIIDEGFRDTEDLDGLFSGFDPETGQYDPTSWHYEPPDERTDEEQQKVRGAHGRRAQRGRQQQSHQAARSESHGSGGAPGSWKRTCVDETLQDPRCVYQILKRHFARYTPEMVQQVCGIEPAPVRGGRGRADPQQRTRAHLGAVLRRGLDASQRRGTDDPDRRDPADPARQHRPSRRRRHGAARTCVHPGLDRHPDPVQHPARLPPDAPRRAHSRWTSGCATTRARPGSGATIRSSPFSLLKAYLGRNAATAENDFCFDYLPRLTGDHSTYATVKAQIEGDCKGYFLVGENPAVGSANGKMQRLGMANLDWLVVRDLQLIEGRRPSGRTVPRSRPASWSPRTSAPRSSSCRRPRTPRRPARSPRPSACSSGATRPSTRPATAPGELQFYVELGNRIRSKLQDSTDERDRPLLDLAWDYPVARTAASPTERQSCARSTAPGPDGAALSAYTELKPDGSTACGCWIYCGVYAGEVNQARRRTPHWEQDLRRRRVGLGLAGQPPDPLQPCVGGARRHPVERAQEVRLVGRRAGEVGRRQCARLHPRPCTRPRAGGRCEGT